MSVVAYEAILNNTAIFTSIIANAHPQITRQVIHHRIPTHLHAHLWGKIGQLEMVADTGGTVGSASPVAGLAMRRACLALMVRVQES